MVPAELVEAAVKPMYLVTWLAKLILLAAPAAIDYYPKTGMTRFTHSFLLDDINDLKG